MFKDRSKEATGLLQEFKKMENLEEMTRSFKGQNRVVAQMITESRLLGDMMGTVPSKTKK